MDEENRARHLAWHETLEMHELAAFQANHLMEFKMKLPNIQDAALRGLYIEAIHGTEQNLRELIPYYQLAPAVPSARSAAMIDLTAFYAGQLLMFAKCAVRNYAIGITETTTPSLRETFQKHLFKCIQLHAKVFYFMLERGYYPAYQLDRLLAVDQKMAQTALSM